MLQVTSDDDTSHGLRILLMSIEFMSEEKMQRQLLTRGPAWFEGARVRD